MNHPRLKTAGLAVVLGLAGCTSYQQPANLGPVASGQDYQAQWRTPDVSRNRADFLRSPALNAQSCHAFLGGEHGPLGKGAGYGVLALRSEKLTRGDLLDIRVEDDATFNGAYEVSRDGTIRLPFLDPIPAQGRSIDEVEAELAADLVKDEFYETAPRVSVRVMDLAPVSVGVSGAVFEPHEVGIGPAGGDQRDATRAAALGASTDARNLSAAIRAAGGVRPDADLSAVELRRGGKVYRIDMRGVFEGKRVVDVMLISGDEVYVPSRECFQQDLMKPSPVSPPGVSLFLSNLTQPAAGNAISAVGQEVREVPWGTRFMQAVVDANCVGGPRSTSADRSALLMTRNPETGVSVVIERDIEDMLRRADRDDYDPYLMPGDAIACYDSTVTSVGEVARVLGLVGVVSFLR
ncbi:polysaccharide biosynthesis/export family protein [Pseudooceanicola sp. CBS1P-1]|uniref:Polysaccharide biosynthesis protein n=1 Tax=Pseudooceanicola albus TaxID=2692189 RepID=A0A6L7FXG8_9RHOB|nr:MULTISPECIES: polysaccharide biosynthesis/export family protein [Pseudooceanicola]MBT9382261.1 polysaccharide biosynthesis/export family protein [Pseudooceanicola endophyticus]MXN16804.1 polysaccharide biosynthesis protein [Pseudooceanicola albus]